MQKALVIPGNNAPAIIAALKKLNKFEISEKNSLDQGIEDIQFIWRPCRFNYYQNIAIQDKMLKREFIITNHVTHSKHISQKHELIKSLLTFYQKNEEARYNIWETTPTTYVVNSGCTDIEFQRFFRKYIEYTSDKHYKEQIPRKHCQQNFWIVKPVNQNQVIFQFKGRGIELFKNIKEITFFLQAKSANSSWIIQKYLEKPLLYRGRKFDLRIWCTFNQKNEVHLYKQGYIRTSSQFYSLDSANNFIHLTNQCLQINSQDYGVHETGNTLSYMEFQKFLQEIFPDLNIDINQHFIPRIKDIIIDSYLAAKQQEKAKKGGSNFELMGYDFMIDEDFRVWLIEVNENPHLGTPCDFMRQLVPKMLDDLFQLQICPEQYDSQKNDFQLIYSDTVNQRQSYSLDHIYPFQKYKEKLQARLKGHKIPFDNDCKKDIKNVSYKDFTTKMKYMLQNYPYTDFDPFIPYIASFKQRLEQLFKKRSQKEIKQSQCQDLCGFLSLIQTSRLKEVFCDDLDNLKVLHNSLSNEAIPQKLKSQIQDFILFISKPSQSLHSIDESKVISFFTENLLISNEQTQPFLAKCFFNLFEFFDRQNFQLGVGQHNKTGQCCMKKCRAIEILFILNQTENYKQEIQKILSFVQLSDFDQLENNSKIENCSFDFSKELLASQIQEQIVILTQAKELKKQQMLLKKEKLESYRLELENKAIEKREQDKKRTDQRIKEKGNVFKQMNQRKQLQSGSIRQMSSRPICNYLMIDSEKGEFMNINEMIEHEIKLKNLQAQKLKIIEDDQNPLMESITQRYRKTNNSKIKIEQIPLSNFKRLKNFPMYRKYYKQQNQSPSFDGIDDSGELKRQVRRSQNLSQNDISVEDQDGHKQNKNNLPKIKNTYIEKKLLKKQIRQKCNKFAEIYSNDFKKIYKK